MTLFIRILGSKSQFKEDLTVVAAPLNGEIEPALVKLNCWIITFYAQQITIRRDLNSRSSVVEL